MIVYFTYGIRNSTENEKNKEQITYVEKFDQSNNSVMKISSSKF